MKKTIGLGLLLGLAVGTTAFAEGRGFGQRGHFFERLDANEDGKITREELGAGVQSRFTEFDLDKNGKVTTDEVKSASEAKLGDKQARMAEHLAKRDENHDGQWSKSELGRMPAPIFEKLDKDQSGTLTKAELEAGRQAWGEHRGGFLQHMWSRIDSNADGAIDNQEAVKAAQTRFDSMDANHDGVLARDEWKVKGHHGCDRGHDHDREATPAPAGSHG